MNKIYLIVDDEEVHYTDYGYFTDRDMAEKKLLQVQTTYPWQTIMKTTFRLIEIEPSK